MVKTFIKTILYSLLVSFFVFLPVTIVYGAEASSANYMVTSSSFGGGDIMNSANFSVTGSLSQSQNVLYTTALLPLVPGDITSCGKIYTPCTYTLTSDLPNITGSCFVVLVNDVIILGGGHTVTGIYGNSSYTIIATSSIVNGGSSFGNLTIQDIVFNNFAGGVNADGNNGTLYGGNGGTVNVLSSVIGSITANAGNASSGAGGNGGSISILGTNLNLAGKTFTTKKGLGLVSGTDGVVTVNGSVLVSGGQVWTGDDSIWEGVRTWKFIDTGYSTGTTTGTTTWTAYTANDGVVTIDNNTNFYGTGKLNGGVVDSLGENILTWNLINSSVLTGSISGNIVFNDTSKNLGTVFDNAVFNNYSYNAGTVRNANFTASSFNSIAGIPNGDPTGISNGHSITGTILFSATTSPVVFNVGVGSVWNANTFGWNFTTPAQNWIFNFSTNSGYISGSAVFSNSQNVGSVDGLSTFNFSSHNAGTTAAAYFYNNSYNIGSSAYASFYDISMNSFSTSAGVVSMQCDFFNSSLPGLGHCPSGRTFYHIPYYFNGTVSTNWGDIGNWYFDASSTEPTLLFPQVGDTVYIGAPMTSGPASSLVLGSIIVASSTTGGGSFSVDFTNASGPAYFYSSSTNSGQVNGVFHIFGDRSFSQVNTNGTYTGAVAFHNGSWNDILIPGDVVFYDTSFNSVDGRVGGNAEFAGTNKNNGVVVGVATIYTGATLSGNGTIQNNTINSGDINSGVFNGIVTSISGAVTGAITNLVQMVFNGGSHVSSSGRLSGDAEFNASSSNRGVVSGDSVFNDSSYNAGSTSNATFVGDLSENIYAGITGIVSGVKTRLYTALAPQITFFRNFADSAWTIIADNTVVKILFGNMINTLGSNSTTFVERNGGFILRPLNPGLINSCGVLDTENGTYTLSSDISNYSYDTCFIVRANGVTLDGDGHSIGAVSSSTSLYAVISTSTMSVDATSSAFTNLAIKNIKFNNFAKGLFGRGTDVPDGIGGNGTAVSIYHSTLGDIDVSGGDPTEKGGDGGDITLETSVAGFIISNGGNSTACGLAGNGGNISITTDSIYATSTNQGGVVTGCPENITPSHGASGRVKTDVISNATKSAQAKTQDQKPASTPSHTANVTPWSLNTITKFLLPVLDISPIKFSPVPIFGTDDKGSFSFLSPLQNFLFTPLSKDVDKITKSILNSFGVKYEKDLLSLQKKPLIISDKKVVPWLYTVSIFGIPTRLSSGNFGPKSDLPMTSYIIFSSKTSVSQLVKVRSKADIIVKANFDANAKASFNGKELVFVGDKVVITTPSKPGRYTLKVSSSPIPLIIEVTAPDSEKIVIPKTSNTNIFKKAINWISNLFRW